MCFSVSPTGNIDRLFDKFTETFSSIIADPEDLKPWKRPAIEISQTIIVTIAQQAGDFSQIHLLKEAFGRDDLRINFS